MAEEQRHWEEDFRGGGSEEPSLGVGPSRPRDTVGRLLRRTRERHGYDLRDVAESLRIRFGYLDAIERGDFDQLPGNTYAVGFVRSYANFLGLDDQEVVRRFKEEAAGVENTQQLHFPKPVNEGKVPGGAVLLLSLVLIAAAYGGWYYMTSHGRSISDYVPAVPERLQALVGEETGGAGTGTSDFGDATAGPATGVDGPGEDTGRSGGAQVAATPEPDDATGRAARGERDTAAWSGDLPPAETGEDNPPPVPRIDDAANAGGVSRPSEARAAEANRTGASATDAAPGTPDTRTTATDGGTRGTASAPAARETAGGASGSTEPPASSPSGTARDTAEPQAEPRQTAALSATANERPAGAGTGNGDDGGIPSAPDVGSGSPGGNTGADDASADDAGTTGAGGGPDTAAIDTNSDGTNGGSEPTPATETASAEGDDGPPAVPEIDAPEPEAPSLDENGIPNAPQTAAAVVDNAERVFGGSNRDSRILLRATADSWVQVRGPDDSLLLTRVLHAGDVYRVPNQEGLVLHTGNAGGLEVLIDGETAGSLGGNGEVRRGISLDPRALR